MCATGAGGVAGQSLDSAELESNAEVDEPYELRDADDDSKEEDKDISNDWRVVGATPHARIFRCISFCRRSAHPHVSASASVRKNVSIASTSARILASDGRRSGLGENILRRSRYAELETGSISNRTVRSIK